jgi:nitrite reductase/ring-hydroxylating ferredoxin subunit
VADAARLICASTELREAQAGVRFEVEIEGEPVPAFAVRHAGRVVGYLNRCSHVAMELDWLEGQFFDADGRDLICSAHGAVYAASSGKCLDGPCGGKPLVRLRMVERGGGVYYLGVADG